MMIRKLPRSTTLLLYLKMSALAEGCWRFIAYVCETREFERYLDVFSSPEIP